MDDEFKVIEEALLNSVPSLQTILFDGWVLRLNQNFTYRANCVCPIDYTADDNITEKIKICENLFISNKLPAVFKVTPVLQENLPRILSSLNYQNIKTVNVMYCVLKDSVVTIRPEIECSQVPDCSWLADSAKLTGITAPDLILIHCNGLKNIAVESIFVKAISNGKTIGCGYGTFERGYVGIYDLHVDHEYRCMGIGTSICNAIMNFGRKHSAKFAYLIVHSKNQNAISLYSHMGFSQLYEYNFYQKSNDTYHIIDA